MLNEHIIIIWSPLTVFLCSHMCSALRRCSEEGHGNPLQCSCLGNPMDRGALQATVHGVAKSQAWLSDKHFHFFTCILISLIKLTL